jgi:hypothetical protein
VSTGPYRTAAPPPATQPSDEERVERALASVLATIRDLDADLSRSVLLAAAVARDLGLCDTAGHDGEVLAMTVGDAERLLKAARGVAT